MSLVDFLVTSNVRRDLLSLLWAEGVIASGHQLALLSKSAYSAVHGELELMKEEGLVVAKRNGRADIYSRNESYRFKMELLSILGAKETKTVANAKISDEDVRANLTKYGTPIVASKPSATELSLEETLVRGLELSRRDSAVARALPVAFARNRRIYDLARLEYLARTHLVLSVLGFYLDLTATLAKDRRLHLVARKLMDRRRKKMELFFRNKKMNRFEQTLAEANTPPIARKWHFLMNMGMDSFESLFKKNFYESDMR